MGPPPPARGALDREVDPGQLTGTTPACAGSTPRLRRASQGRADHPRLRGEHGVAQSTVCKLLGPPPPARGARRPRPGPPRRLRTTPACAGSTTRRNSPTRTDGDHPRLRGEHDFHRGMSPSGMGPPPPARGALLPGRCESTPTGTTPACAGSTGASPRTRCGVRDHPRLRGEHRFGTSSASLARGPPPPARGAPGPTPRRRRRGGTTPACAGSTARSRRCRSSPRDHPRLRGEHKIGCSTFAHSQGPPPPARGARGPGGGPLLASGTTPACAGSTT